MGPTLVMGLVLAMTASGWGGEIFIPEVHSLDEADTVLTARLESGSTVLPVESLAFYLEGVEARKRGDSDRAAASFQLATELDPAFPEAHLAFARLNLFRNPRATLEQLGKAFPASTQSFRAQHLSLVNALFGVLLLMAVGIVVLIAYAAFQHLPRVHHSLVEYLKLWFYTPLAVILAVAVLCAPALWQLGLLPLAFVFFGLMWSWMRKAERRWAGVFALCLVLGPVAVYGLSPLLLSPLDPQEPAFLISRTMSSSYSPGLAKALEAAIEERSENPDLHFALGIMYKRGGRWRAAEKEFERARELGASEAAVLNNLGVISFLRGNYDTAMERLQSSVEKNPQRAASHFNLSQTYAKKLYFDRAEEELQKANALSFNRIRATLRYSEGDNRRTLIDEPLPNGAFWRAAREGSRRMPGLPDWLRPFFPGSLWFLGPACVISFIVAFVLGRRLYRTLPSFDCMNCGRPVCRRCLRRIRRNTYCSPCGDALLQIQSTSYTKLVLDSRIKRKRRLAYLLTKLTSWIFPGFHAARLGRTHLSAILALTATAAVLTLLTGDPPLTRLVWSGEAPRPWWPEFPLFALIAAMVGSVITVIRLRPPSVLKPQSGLTDALSEEEPVSQEIDTRVA